MLHLKAHTGVDGFSPIPVVVMRYDSILSVSIIHLSRIPADLIQLHPVVLRGLSVKVSDTPMVWTPEDYHAVVLVAFNMQVGDTMFEFQDKLLLIGEIGRCCEMFALVNVIAAHCIVAVGETDVITMAIGFTVSKSLQFESVVS